MSRQSIQFSTFVFAVTLLSACGGGGGGGDDGNGNGGVNPPPVQRTPETVAFSAADGIGSIGATEVFTIRDDGSQLTRLSADSALSTSTILDFAISPNGEWVAYIANTTSDVETALYVNSINGGTPLQVSRTRQLFGSRVNSFQWSPDSSQLVYSGPLDAQTVSNQFASEVFLVNRDGTGDTKINGGIGAVATVEVRNPQWSPDGRYILQDVALFSGQQGGANPYGLNIYDSTITSGVNSRRLVTSVSTIRNTGWSANGDRVSYTADQERLNTYDVFAINADGSGNVRVTSNGDFDSESKWSPDSSQLAYLDHPSGGLPADLVVSGATSGAVDTVLVFLSQNGQRVYDFAWSPDGTRIAYTSDQDSQSRELFVINADGSSAATKVSGPQTDTSDVFDFAWSPDGSQIAYVSDAETNTFIDLYVSNANGSGTTLLSSSLAGEEVVDFAWSADGQRITFSTGPEGRTPQANKLYATQPNGAGRVEITEPMTGGPLAFEYD